jgi:hypothetical protein
MEVHLDAELQGKLSDLAARRGRADDDSSAPGQV